MQVVNSALKSSKPNKNLSLPFTPKRFINDEVSHTESLQVSLWKDMENREYPERKVLVSNLIHDREAVMLYSPTGVGKTWLSLAIGMICAGGGRLDLVEWENDEPQPVCYLDGEMLEEDIQERMKLLIPSLNLNEDELRENFHFISRVSQPDDIEDFLSFEEEQHQKELLNWVKSNSCKGKHPLIILDNLSNLVELRDDNSAGQMQNFNMMVTKARKYDCSMVIVHHTGKQMTVGPDGVPTWRGSYDMATRLDKTICLMPCDSSLDGFVTFQILEGKSRRGQRLKMSVQFNPFEKKWEIFDQSSTEDRNELVHELLKNCWVAKYEDLSDILERSPSSAERYIKQAIDSEFFKEEEWKRWKREAKKGGYDREARIEKGKQHIKDNYKVHMNERGSGGRFIVERLNNYFNDECYEEDADF